MDLNEKQKMIYQGIKESSREGIAVSESMGLSHAFAVLSDKVEIINLMLVPAMSSTGMIAGEVKEMYKGRGPDAEVIRDSLANALQSVSQLASIFEFDLEEIAEIAFREHK